VFLLATLSLRTYVIAFSFGKLMLSQADRAFEHFRGAGADVRAGNR